MIVSKTKKSIAPNDVYTAILTAATGIVVITAIIVAVKCISEYGTLFKIVKF